LPDFTEKTMIDAPLVDTHCHLYWPGLHEDAAEVILQAQAAGVRYIVVPGLDMETSLQAQELARNHECVYFAAGVHPAEAEKHQGFATEDFFKPFAGDPKLVAVGEIGLDAHYDRAALELQLPLLQAQLEYASAHSLPAILHHRDAGKELINLLGGFPNLRGVFHCFDGSKKLLKFAVERGFFISIAGNVTYPSAHNLNSQLMRIPEELLLVETDAPYMPPESVRAQRKCVPADVALTAAYLAAALAKSENMLRISLFRNSCRLFSLPGDV
jgi:TatD DNase family protein